MPKKEMTPEQASLFTEMKRLAKRANQRIVELERLVGDKEPFGVKQLADYLSSQKLQAWTEKGRVSYRKSLTKLQMQSIKKALNQFLKNEVSTLRDVRKFAKEESRKARYNIPIPELSALYIARKDYEWIYDYFPGSSYWDFAREMVRKGWNYETYEQEISKYITDTKIDDYLKKKLQRLYEYSQGVRGA